MKEKNITITNELFRELMEDVTMESGRRVKREQTEVKKENPYPQKHETREERTLELL